VGSGVKWLLALLLLSGNAVGQPYPSKPVKIIVPLAAGGTGDTLARLVGEEMSKSLGAAFVVENRPGSGGTIGTDAVAKAPADGYTLLHTSNSHVMQPAMRSDLPYDALRDFAVVVRTADTHQALFANPAFPPNTVQELIAYAKTHKVFYGSAGNGSATHLHMELLKLLAGIDLEHVPYKGSTQARTDLLSGQVQLTFDGLLPNLPHMKAGKLKALALASSHRSGATPEIPTLSEAGVPGYRSDTWYALFAPSAVPKEVLEKLRSAAQSALRVPGLRAKLLQQGAEPSDATPAELEASMKSEFEGWKQVVKKANIKAD
jgi:tripartite-type tricarboxylate transporter receptor subunit TctC